MGAVKRSTWIGGAVFFAVAIAVAAWFLIIAPTIATAADSRAQAESTRQQNQVLALSVTKLKADFAKLPAYRAELATLRGQIPAGAALSDYLRQLSTIAAARSVAISVTPAPPLVVVPAVAVAPVAPVAAPATPAAATPAATPAPAAPVAAAPVPGTALTAIPISITATGSYDQTLAFLNDLQTATPRLFLVSGLTSTAKPASTGTAAEQELLISGFAYVLPDPAVAK
jgi:Tfp pilus assembly protein PilO